MVGRLQRLRHIIELYKLYTRMDLAWFLRDTKICVLAITADFVSNIAAVTGIFLLAWRFGGVGGMDKYEVLFMLGYVTVVTGIIQAFFNYNISHISRRIGRGQFEHMLMQPLPLYIQLMTEGFIPFSGTSNLVSGTMVMAFALGRLGIEVNGWWLASLIGNLGVTTIIVMALNYLFSTAAFYAPVQAEEISSYVRSTTGNLSTYPLSGMSFLIQLPLLTVFPAGLLGWFPTLALLGKAPLGLPSFYPAIVAGMLVFLTTVVFRRGLQHYLQAGSIRYSAVGHRR